MLRDALHEKVEHRHPALSVVEGTLSIFTNVQGANQSLDDYVTMFNAHIEQVKAHKGRSWCHPKLVATAMEELRLSSTPLAERVIAAEKTADKAFLALLFIVLADKGRYGEQRRS